VPTTDFKKPTVMTNLTGSVVTTWNNVNFAPNTDANYVSTFIPDEATPFSTVARVLCRDFEDFAIPAGATINGVQVRVRPFDSYGTSDIDFQLGCNLYNRTTDAYIPSNNLGNKKEFFTTYAFNSFLPFYDQSDPTTFGYAAYNFGGNMLVWANTPGSAGNDIVISIQIPSDNPTTDIGVDGFVITVTCMSSGGVPSIDYSDIVTLINSDMAASALVTAEWIDNNPISSEDGFFQNGIDVPSGLTLYTLGSTSDVWGATLTRDIVMGENFGVTFFFPYEFFTAIELYYYFNNVEMAITYTESGGAGRNLLLSKVG